MTTPLVLRLLREGINVALPVDYNIFLKHCVLPTLHRIRHISFGFVCAKKEELFPQRHQRSPGDEDALAMHQQLVLCNSAWILVLVRVGGDISTN